MKYRKVLLSAVLTAVFLFLLMKWLSIVVTPKTNSVDAGNDNGAAYGFEAEPEGVLDAVILGNSESRTSISPMELFHEYGITSYCAGVNSEDLSETREMLRRVLRTQSPGLIIIECDVLWTSFTWQEELDSVMSTIFPVFRWHDRWKTLTINDFTSIPDNDHVETRKGYYNTWIVKPPTQEMMDAYMKEDTGESPLASNAMRVLEDMASMCRDNGTDILLLSIPCPYYWTWARHNTVTKIAEELNQKAEGSGTSVVFADMNVVPEEVGIDWNTDSRDGGNHMNDSGMRKVNAWLGPYLKEHYDLKDHRDDPLCKETWTDMYDDYLYAISKESYEKKESEKKSGS